MTDCQLNKIKEAAEEYSRLYRANNLGPFEFIEELYSLYPSPEEKYGWNDYYPFYNRAGIYLAFDENKKLIYIGKASMSNKIGHRVGARFKQGANGECEPKSNSDGWAKECKYLSAIAVPHAFEAPSLEEYLIGVFAPKFNSVGK